jgi:alpha,alpha-trehalase
MMPTIRGMLENFIAMIKTYGFIPNGGRVYYEKRSQPPMFIMMVKHYLDNLPTITDPAKRAEAGYEIDFLRYSKTYTVTEVTDITDTYHLHILSQCC